MFSWDFTWQDLQRQSRHLYQFHPKNFRKASPLGSENRFSWSSTCDLRNGSLQLPDACPENFCLIATECIGHPTLEWRHVQLLLSWTGYLGKFSISRYQELAFNRLLGAFRGFSKNSSDVIKVSLLIARKLSRRRVQNVNIALEVKCCM